MGIAGAILGAGVLGAGSSIFGGLMQSNAANKAISAQQQMFAQIQANEQPFIKAGQQAIPTLQGLITPGANQTALLQQTPGYMFANDMAQKGVLNQATTTGLGGNSLLAASNAAQQMALFNAWQPTVNSLQSLVNTGAQTAGNLGNQGTQTAQNIGNNLVGIGNAQAGAATSVGANLGNSLTSAALFSKLLNNSNMYGSGSQNSSSSNFLGF
jgi:hypothetical protein